MSDLMGQVSKAFDEAKHQRKAKGPGGGQFAPKNVGQAVAQIGSAVRDRLKGVARELSFRAARATGKVPGKTAFDRAVYAEWLDDQQLRGKPNSRELGLAHRLRSEADAEDTRLELEQMGPEIKRVLDSAFQDLAGGPPPKESEPTVLWHGTAKEHMDKVLQEGLQTAKVLGRSGVGWGYDRDADGEADEPGGAEADAAAAHSRLSQPNAQITESRWGSEDRVKEMKEWVRLHPDLAQSRANSVYMAKDEKTAERYAYDSAKRVGSDQVALVQITVPSNVKLVDDEFWQGAYRLEGNIPPSWITGYKVGTAHPNGIAWTNLMETSAAALKSLVKAAMSGGRTLYVPVVLKGK